MNHSPSSSTIRGARRGTPRGIARGAMRGPRGRGGARGRSTINRPPGRMGPAKRGTWSGGSSSTRRVPHNAFTRSDGIHASRDPRLTLSGGDNFTSSFISSADGSPHRTAGSISKRRSRSGEHLDRNKHRDTLTPRNPPAIRRTAPESPRPPVGLPRVKTLPGGGSPTTHVSSRHRVPPPVPPKLSKPSSDAPVLMPSPAPVPVPSVFALPSPPVMEGASPSSCALGETKAPSSHTSERMNVLSEILSTEQKYVDSLQVMHKHFVIPMQAMVGDSVVQEIFSNLSMIISVNSDLLSSLRERVGKAQSSEDLDCQVADIFFATADYLKLYSAYTNNLPNARVALQKQRSGNEMFEKLIKDAMAHPEVGGATVQSLLIQPVQRICRYELLLRELAKHTPEDHEDFHLLCKAREKVHAVATYVDEQNQQAENVSKLFIIQQSLSALGKKNVVHPGRVFVREGDLQQFLSKKQQKTRRLFLFNDILVLASHKTGSRYHGGGGPEGDRASEAFHMKEWIDLSELKLLAGDAATPLPGNPSPGAGEDGAPPSMAAMEASSPLGRTKSDGAASSSSSSSPHASSKKGSGVPGDAVGDDRATRSSSQSHSSDAQTPSTINRCLRFAVLSKGKKKPKNFLFLCNTESDCDGWKSAILKCQDDKTQREQEYSERIQDYNMKPKVARDETADSAGGGVGDGDGVAGEESGGGRVGRAEAGDESAPAFGSSGRSISVIGLGAARSHHSSHHPRRAMSPPPNLGLGGGGGSTSKDEHGGGSSSSSSSKASFGYLARKTSRATAKLAKAGGGDKRSSHRAPAMDEVGTPPTGATGTSREAPAMRELVNELSSVGGGDPQRHHQGGGERAQTVSRRRKSVRGVLADELFSPMMSNGGSRKSVIRRPSSGSTAAGGGGEQTSMAAMLEAVQAENRRLKFDNAVLQSKLSQAEAEIKALCAPASAAKTPGSSPEDARDTAEVQLFAVRKALDELTQRFAELTVDYEKAVQKPNHHQKHAPKSADKRSSSKSDRRATLSKVGNPSLALKGLERYKSTPQDDGEAMDDVDAAAATSAGTSKKRHSSKSTRSKTPRNRRTPTGEAAGKSAHQRRKSDGYKLATNEDVLIRPRAKMKRRDHGRDDDDDDDDDDGKRVRPVGDERKHASGKEDALDDLAKGKSSENRESAKGVRMQAEEEGSTQANEGKDDSPPSPTPIKSKESTPSSSEEIGNPLE